MKKEAINYDKLREMEQQLGCHFCENGEFAEMSLELADYTEKTQPVAHITYGFYQPGMGDIKETVALVDEDWVQYFGEDSCIFCGFSEGKPVSFCLVDESIDGILLADGIKVGSIGCVGTVPQYRKQGIGIRMVDLATVYLKDKGCDKSYIHYTHIAPWYEKLGYQTFTRFSFE